MSTGLRTRVAITIATAGTEQQVESTFESTVQAVRFEADDGNAGAIFIGDLNVSATRYTAKLAAGDSFTLEGSAVNLTTIFVDTDTNGSIVQVSTI